MDSKTLRIVAFANELEMLNAEIRAYDRAIAKCQAAMRKMADAMEREIAAEERRLRARASGNPPEVRGQNA